MANENLRAALQQAGLSPDDLARIAQVDVRTVRRWLSGGTPYPRQRGKVARALDTTEHDLWPHIPTGPPARSAAQASDLVAGYPAGSALGAPDWKALMRDASDRIDLLADTLTDILDTPGVPELLAAKATGGCAIRILVYDTHHHLAPLLDHPDVDVRLLEAPADYNIHRFDEQLLLTLHTVGGDPANAPLMHLRRAAPGGLFDRLAAYYDDLWEQHSQPPQGLDPAAEEDDDDESEIVEPEPSLLSPEPPAASHNEPPARAPRRWPRRPESPDTGRATSPER